MMKHIAEEIIKEAKELGYGVSNLSAPEADKLKSLLADAFGIQSWTRIWETLGECPSVQDPDAWKWLDEFVEGDEAVMFFDENDDKSMVLFGRESSISSVLSECTGFEFYLTNTTGDYLICFNHHDFLIGAGVASDWVAIRRANLK